MIDRGEIVRDPPSLRVSRPQMAVLSEFELWTIRIPEEFAKVLIIVLLINVVLDCIKKKDKTLTTAHVSSCYNTKEKIIQPAVL